VDFICTNKSFSLSSASFVETIKACEPITTTAIALFYGIEILRLPEAFSIALMMAGVFFSTMGEAAGPDEDGSSAETVEEAELRRHRSILTCVIVLSANICFGFRIKSQKMLRRHAEWKPVDDANLLMWMQQIGAVALIGPIMMFEFRGIVHRTMDSSWAELRSYCLLSIANASAFSVYSVAGSYVLTRVSVAQYTGFGCLRRMNAIICTSLAFGVPISLIGVFGICLSLSGFLGFSTYRYSNPPSVDVRVSSPTSPSAKLSLKTWKVANL
jgi:drug/metabolite transporter (DMT)-like permease